MVKKPTPAHTIAASAPAQPWAAPGQGAGTPQPVAGVTPAPAADTPAPVDDTLDDSERAVFDAFMAEQAKLKMAQLIRSREARAMAVNIIDGNAHYGNKIPGRGNR